MKHFDLERSQHIDRPLEEVFAFFSAPSNLERITPPWLGFEVVGTSTPELGEGTIIDYRLRLHGLPLRWRSLIRSWDPPYGFVDEQLKGPYRSWVHTHRFERDGGGTLVRDHVRYAVPGGALVERLFVRRDIERIFDFRVQALEAHFAPRTPVRDPA